MLSATQVVTQFGERWKSSERWKVLKMQSIIRTADNPDVSKNKWTVIMHRCISLSYLGVFGCAHWLWSEAMLRWISNAVELHTELICLQLSCRRCGFMKL